MTNAFFFEYFANANDLHTTLEIMNLFKSNHLDAIGFTASTLCAIHCLAIPFVITFLPVLGLEFLANAEVELTIIFLGVIIGVASLAHGYSKHHHNIFPILILIFGFTIIGFGHVGTAFTDAYHSFITPIGALFVAGAHIANMRLFRDVESCEHHGVNHLDLKQN